MQITNKIIENAIENISGPEGLKLFRILKKRKNISEFVLADKLRLSINEVRNLLYKLDAYDLIKSTRRKDKRKGWYIYYWTLEKNKLDNLIIKLKKDELKILKNKLEKEKVGDFFVCPHRCSRQRFEDALANNFMCLECGDLMSAEDNDKAVSKLRSEIIRIETELKNHAK